MNRNIPLIIAFSASLAVPVAHSAESATRPSAAQVAKDIRHTPQGHLTHVSEQRKNAVAISAKSREAIAMAPAQAEVGGWRVKLAAAGPASEVTQDLSRHEEEQEGNDKLNIYGMLAAALGLGLMSIVRRMGRF